jgi:hypothetical protein
VPATWLCVNGRGLTRKLQHWRGFRGSIALEGAPMLEFACFLLGRVRTRRHLRIRQINIVISNEERNLLFFSAVGEADFSPDETGFEMTG